MKKVVVKSNFHDQKSKKKVMKAVSSITGIDSMSADVNEGKLTVIGDIDPVRIAKKLRAKKCAADIISVELVSCCLESEDQKPVEETPPPPEEVPVLVEEKHIEEMKEQISSFLKTNYENRNPFVAKHYCVHNVDESPNLMSMTLMVVPMEPQMPTSIHDSTSFGGRTTTICGRFMLMNILIGRSIQEILESLPDGVNHNQFENLIKFWRSDKEKVVLNQNKKNRAKMTHHSGTESFSQRAYKLKNEGVPEKEILWRILYDSYPGESRVKNVCEYLKSDEARVFLENEGMSQWSMPSNKNSEETRKIITWV